MFQCIDCVCHCAMYIQTCKDKKGILKLEELLMGTIKCLHSREIILPMVTEESGVSEGEKVTI